MHSRKKELLAMLSENIDRLLGEMGKVVSIANVMLDVNSYFCVERKETGRDSGIEFERKKNGEL